MSSKINGLGDVRIGSDPTCEEIDEVCDQDIHLQSCLAKISKLEIEKGKDT